MMLEHAELALSVTKARIWMQPETLIGWLTMFGPVLLSVPMIR